MYKVNSRRNLIIPQERHIDLIQTQLKYVENIQNNFKNIPMREFLHQNVYITPSFVSDYGDTIDPFTDHLRVFITSAAGYGKTLCLCNSFIKRADKFISNENEKILPIYIEAKNIEIGQSLFDYIQTVYGYDLSGCHLGSIALFVDGVDEFVHNDRKYLSFLFDINFYQIFMTCRIQYKDFFHNYTRTFLKVSIAPWTNNDIKQFLENANDYRDLTDNHRECINRIIQNSRSEITPIYITLLIFAVISENINYAIEKYTVSYIIERAVYAYLNREVYRGKFSDLGKLFNHVREIIWKYHKLVYERKYSETDIRITKNQLINQSSYTHTDMSEKVFSEVFSVENNHVKVKTLFHSSICNYLVASYIYNKVKTNDTNDIFPNGYVIDSSIMQYLREMIINDKISVQEWVQSKLPNISQYDFSEYSSVIFIMSHTTDPRISFNIIRNAVLEENDYDRLTVLYDQILQLQIETETLSEYEEAYYNLLSTNEGFFLKDLCSRLCYSGDNNYQKRGIPSEISDETGYFLLLKKYIAHIKHNEPRLIYLRRIEAYIINRLLLMKQHQYRHNDMKSLLQEYYNLLIEKHYCLQEGHEKLANLLMIEINRIKDSIYLKYGL